MSEYISAAEAAEKWGISKRRVTLLCGTGRIAGASLVGKYWIIPIDAEKPSAMCAKRNRTLKTD